MPEPDIQETLNAALRHHRAGRLGQAEQLYRRLLERQPDHADALRLLGIVAVQTGRGQEAIALMRRAAELRPGDAVAHGDLGNALADMGRWEEAAEVLRRAVALNPNRAESHSGLGRVLRAGGQTDEAVAACRRAVALKPDLMPAHWGLGNALTDRGDLEEAAEAYRRALALAPGAVEVHSNLGNVLREKGDLDEAIAACRRAVALKPDFASGHATLALALLTKGDYRQGWEEYEWRWASNYFTSPRREFGQPQWDGRPAPGRTLLLHAEQGLGDAIQFARYLPLAARRFGGQVVAEFRPELLRLLQPLAAAAGCGLTAHGQPLPAFDLHCPLLGLPRLFGTTLENLPRDMPYLVPDAAGAETWRRRLESSLAAVQKQPCGQPLSPALSPEYRGEGENAGSFLHTSLAADVASGSALQADRHAEQARRLNASASSLHLASFSPRAPDPAYGLQPKAYSLLRRVGLAWAGSAAHRSDRHRSISLSRLAPLARVPGVRFVSLQKGPPAAQAQSSAAGMALLDFTEELRDLADTAALIANLDLVIGVDTAVVHLAGAMAKPVWTLLPAASDWRWLRGRDDSPWYPTMRLFRRSARDDWDDWDAVIARVAEALAQWAAHG